MLDRELAVYQEKGWVDRVIEILIVKTLALDTIGHIDAGVETMQSALQLAEPAGYIRLFLDEGDQIVKYLNASSGQSSPVGDYARLLLAHYSEKPSQPHLNRVDQAVYIEPLTPRELEILNWIADGLSNKEIGLKLSISLGTVKRHTANIYGKLNTNNRTHAVAVARKLKFIV